MDTLTVNQQAEGVVTGYTSQGQGVVRLGGAVVFVPGAVRGEEIALRVTRVMKNAAAGELLRVLRPSPGRRKPDCPYYGACGGCAFRHLTYEEELWAKRQRVQDALSRIGGCAVEVEEIIGAREPLRYRNKCQYPVGADGSVGFYRAGSHQVVPVGDCLIQTEEANRTARAVREWMERYHVRPYDERTKKGLVRHIYVRTNHRGESLCCVVANARTLPREPELAGMILQAVPHTLGVVLNVNTRPGNVILGESYRTLWGQDYLWDTLRGLEFQLSVPSFYQVNRRQAEVLYGKALEFAELTGRETALDLYCGAGTITLCLAGRVRRVIGAEIVGEAVENARNNAERNGINNAEFFCADAAEIAAKLAEEGLRPDIVTVDPPRKGLEESVIDSITAMNPGRVVYVSCDPGTLGRDVKRFAEKGYHALRAVAVDMFPRTAHVETVVQLSQQKPDTYVTVGLDLDELDATSTESKATYKEIQDYVWEKHGLKVSALYISQVKRKCGLEVGKHYNLSKSDNPKVPVCPKEKEDAIMEALRWFKMIV